MSTITLPNIRVSSDLTVKLKLKDGGVAIDWSTLTNIRVSIYSDAQKALAGRCSASIDEDDNTILVCQYAANKPQYVGVNRVVVSAKYMNETKTYDKPAFNFVRWTDDQEGQTITIDDPDIDVEISVEDVSSSILQEAVDAANTAAERANEAAEAAEHMVDIHTGPAGKSPYIGENGHWYEWDEETNQYVDTETNAKGDTGETPDISIGTVTTVEPGTPAAASMTGTPEAPVLNLSIPKGAVGATPNFTVGTVTTGQPGTPVVITITGTAAAPVLNITIPQGLQGNTGSSVEYPYELVNNLTTNDATKGLSAAQGKVLKDELTQLEAEVDDIQNDVIHPTCSIMSGGVSENGTIVASTWYSYTSPIPLKKGQTINVETEGYLFGVISDASTTPLTVLVYIPTNPGSGVSVKYSYTAPSDMNVVVCVKSNTAYDFYITGRITDLEKRVDILDSSVSTLDEYVNGKLTETKNASSGVTYDNRIYWNFKSGQKYSFEYLGTSVASFLAVQDDAGNVLQSNMTPNAKTGWITLTRDTTYITLARAGAFVTSSGSVTFNIYIYPDVVISQNYNNEKTSLNDVAFADYRADLRLDAQINRKPRLVIGALQSSGPVANSAYARFDCFLVPPFQLKLNSGYEFVAVYNYGFNAIGEVTYNSNSAISGSSYTTADNDNNLHNFVIKKSNDNNFISSDLPGIVQEFKNDVDFVHEDISALRQEIQDSIKEMSSGVLSNTMAATAGVTYDNRIYFDFKAGEKYSFEYDGDSVAEYLAVQDDAANILYLNMYPGTKTGWIELTRNTAYITLARNGAFVTSSGAVTFKINISYPFGEDGIYLYPFRTIANRVVYLYKDAVFTGLNPRFNYEVRAKKNGNLQNYTKKCLRFEKTAGTYTATVEVANSSGSTMEKSVQVKVVNMPSVKLSGESSLDVFFFGDSIINQNDNKIGVEFQRMLSTNNQGGVNADGSILLPAYNVCPGKINLVGEMHNGTNHWQYLYKLAQAFTEKRDVQYGAEVSGTYWQTHNPFYNLNSTEPDEIGPDGFNKRVDFGWYFENACGVGKYPKLIYIAIGANDYYANNNWDISIAPSLAEKMVALCKKIKEGCDTIAGGESGIKIKIFNHQTYPLTSAHTVNLPIERARRVQLACYDAYYKAIMNAENGVDGFVEFVDCGSKFDWVNGYNKQQVATNARCTATDDVYITETVHMNPVGAYNYADCLIDDFLADTDFD